MTRGEAPAGPPAWGGLDTHRDTHTLVLLDARGRVASTGTFATDAAGLAALCDACGDAPLTVAVEGCRSYGAAAADALAAAGHEVLEALRPRRERRRGGKSDPIDAERAARAAMAGSALPRKRLEGAAGELRWLLSAREQEVRRATAASAWAAQMLATAPEALRRRYEGMPAAARMRALARSRGRGAAERALRSMAGAWADSRARADALGREVEEVVRREYPALLAMRGAGPVSCARLIVAAGSNPGRMGSEAAFAMLCGAAPVPASSGRTDRVRLNRGGDRQANRALHEIALALEAGDARTRAYLARKRAEGKSRREAVRCLCRTLARKAYRLLTGPQEAPRAGSELAAARRSLGLTQARAAEGLGWSRSLVSAVERGARLDAEAAEGYEAWLRSLGADFAAREEDVE